MNIILISPFKDDFVSFNEKFEKKDNINVIYQKNRFEYLKNIKENNNIFCIRDFYIFEFEKSILQDFSNFIFYSDINELLNKDFLNISNNFEINDKLNDLFYLVHTWDNIIYSFLGKIFPGFIHNISSPITALSGKFSIAKLVNKPIEVDENLIGISDKILRLIRNFQFIFESLNYLEPQKVDISSFIDNMIDVFNANLEFKHNIKLIINKQESFSNFTVLAYLIFFYLYLVSEIVDFIGNRKITLFMDILKENGEKVVYLKFDFDGDFDFMNYNSFDELNFSNFNIERIYLLWNYLIPENIIINTVKTENTNIVKIIYK